MSIIFKECEKPVIVIDDFDAGNGLCFDQYEDRKLDLNYIAESVPADYKFCLNPWSYRNRGVIFIFPGSAPYGCTLCRARPLLGREARALGQTAEIGASVLNAPVRSYPLHCEHALVFPPLPSAQRANKTRQGSTSFLAAFGFWRVFNGRW